MSQQPPFATYPSLANKTVLITGGAQGIGAAAVRLFALQGCRVAFLDLAQAPALALVEDLTSRCTHPPLFVSCDVTNIPALQSAIADISAKLTPPTVLINNAANDDRHRFEDVTPEYWDQRMDVNLRHHFFATQALVAGMMRAGGRSRLLPGGSFQKNPQASLRIS